MLIRHLLNTEGKQLGSSLYICRKVNIFITDADRGITRVTECHQFQLLKLHI